MKLPFLHLLQKKVPAEYFLALLFRDEQIQAVVFEQIAGRIQVVGEGKATLQTSVERASDEMLLDTADKAISVAEEALPDNIETHKTIFGVKESWVSDTHITKEYLDKLKIISKELDLQPIGFLVFPEAIAHLLQKEEGAPVSAILIESGKQQITITLLRAGRIVDTKEVSLGESITETVENALRSFEDVEIFPSRIVLFDTGDEALEKKFLTHKWSKSLPFLHVPQITVLPKDFDTRAVLFGTATQMGFDAIDVIKQPIRKHDGQFAEEFEQEPAPLASKPLEEEESPAEEMEEAEPTEQPTREEKHEEEPLEEVSGEDTSEYFGFVKNADVAQTTGGAHATKLPHEAIEPVTEEVPEEEKEEELAGSAYGFSASGPIFFEGAKKILSQWKRFVPSRTSLDAVSETASQFALPSFLKGNKLVLLVPAIVVVLLAGLIWYIVGLHAAVTLILSPKIVSQDQTITFTTTGATDPTKNIVAAQTVSVSEEGKISGTATGTKTTGTPAKGTVTIFNSDSAPHTLAAGTVITSSNGLNFTLDNSVTVASGSSDPTNLSAGTADAAVTASDIGTNYNLPSQTKFTLASTAVLAAKNSNAFSGGTSTTITVVSQKDLDNLASQLTENLKDKAKTDLQAKATNGEVILPDFTKTTAGVTNFDKKINEQASTINLDGTITYETIAYQKSDIESYTKEALSGKLPTDLTLAPNGITYSVKNMATKDGTTTVTLTIQAALIPTIDTASLAKQIAGKNFIQAKDILSNVSQFSDATFTISPNLFFLPQTLPRLSHNITISIKTNE